MVKNGRRFSKWMKKKTKYLGKPYKSPEEKITWKQALKEARLKAIKVKAKREAKRQVLRKGRGGGILGTLSGIGEQAQKSAFWDMTAGPVKAGKPTVERLGGLNEILGFSAPRPRRKKRRRKKRKK